MDRRSDIDGLRALAVWLVLLFHAGLNDLRGIARFAEWLRDDPAFAALK